MSFFSSDLHWHLASVPPLRRFLASVAILLPISLTAVAQGIDPLAPEAASGFAQKESVSAKKFMVSAANPHAVQAGYSILKRGGSAVDAAIATQMVLTLCEPQSSGIGGGAFMLHFDGKGVQAYDGRETAPAAVDGKLFLSPDGTPMKRSAAIVGGRSVGVPGVLRMLELAHKEQGKLAWASLFEPAIKLAEEGFVVSPRLFKLLQGDPFLKQDPVAAAYYYDEHGKPRPPGYVLKNPALAATLRTLAKEGAKAMYQGKIAQAIVEKVRNHPSNPGSLSLPDLEKYQAKKRDAICTDYRQYTVCGMPPPSSGGIAVAQVLGILEGSNIASLTPQNGVPRLEALHLLTEAQRLAYADRDYYAGDTDFVPLPGRGVAALIDPQYLAKRATLLGEKSMGTAKPGSPPFAPDSKLSWGKDQSPELPSTSHFSIVDSEGHAVAMTTTIEDGFGSRLMVDGFLLNNQLTDFSFVPQDETGLVANRVQGGKRPRSSMSPTLVFDKNTKKLQLAIGSPGGPAIIMFVAKVLVGVLDWNLTAQQAIALPNFGSRNGPTILETGFFSPEYIAALKAKGHTVIEYPMTSGLHGVMRGENKGESVWVGGADPRREGIIMGE